ncbi:Zn-dependent protease (includes SpoIVFB) [Geoalkalibacter ferrihydriticus]|uniref:Peptidase n=2 Tax=Geoalkalibacter ferrihydriticus TaxID=392333 RepID=A0A0C2HPC9_9BACT|nr:site-2 protease family protein [Geoalkalibacter ferrihydriticus]KIH76760.1 peptidase [Geoalkalibacter ferrihydriticus DSM 17813]SDL52929.1 Zn-dependent protease (includes SpoIVFB) [Geoalkalibacter ferrihydriticus]
MENILAKISIMLVPALMAVTIHEVAHGFFADRFGDPTARLLGRLTPNPVKHLDPVGTLALLIFGFGWARPVPVNFHNLRKPKTDMIWVALAGPLANLFLAMVSAFVLHSVILVAELLPADQQMAYQFLEPLALMAGFSLYINIILAVFNLLPVPPLDGGRVMVGILPPRQADMLARIEPFGFILIIFLIFFTDIYRLFLAPIVFGMVSFMAGSQEYMVFRAIEFLFGR